MHPLQRLFSLLVVMALLFVSAPPSAVAQPASDTIRVGVGRSLKEATASADVPFDLYNGTELIYSASAGWHLRVKLTSGGLEVAELGTFKGPLRLKPQGGLARYKNLTYRGELELLVNSQGTLSVVNVIGVEDYLRGVVPKEAIPNWHQEALKAQAVVARSYAVVQRQAAAFKAEGFDVVDTVASQVYGGASAEHPNTDAAVKATAGQVLTHNGKVITAYFFASSGGHTEKASIIWSSDLPYLVAVADPYDQVAGNPNFSWSSPWFSRQEVEARLGQAGYPIGTLLEVRKEGVGDSGRAHTVRFVGSSGEAAIRGNATRDVFDLKSFKYDIEQEAASAGYVGKPLNQTSVAVVGAGGRQATVQLSGQPVAGATSQGQVGRSPHAAVYQVTPARLRFVGGGWGHGVGMSQWGAQGMASQGFGYQEILQHYYKDVRLETY